MPRTGRPRLGGMRGPVRLTQALADALDARIERALAAGMSPEHVISRCIRAMIREGVAALDQGAPIPADGPLIGRTESFQADTDIDAAIGALADRMPATGRSERVRALLSLSAAYTGEPIDVYPWMADYGRALEGATADQGAALRARMDAPDATESEIAAALGITLGAYKNRCQRALARVR